MKNYIRQKQILEHLSTHDILSVNDAVVLFGVSPATVRRDFTELAASGSVKRICGGIARNIVDQAEPQPFILREKWYSAEKRFLAAQLFKYIQEAKTIFIDGGTTTAHLGMFLKNPEQAVITNSVPLCNIVSEMFPAGGGAAVYMTGGRFNPTGSLLLGSNAEAAVAKYHADVAVISVRGIDENGLYNHNEDIAAIGRTMIANADKTVVIADHSKIGQRAMNKVSPLSSIEALFTVETNENRMLINKIRKSGIKVFCENPFNLL